MKILLKVALAGLEVTLAAGTVVEVDDAYGKQMIEDGYAAAAESGEAVADLRAKKKSAVKATAKPDPVNAGTASANPDLIGDPNPGDTTGNA